MNDLQLSKPTEPKHNEFKCCICNTIYEKGWTDEECEAEYQANHTANETKANVLICDHCYSKFDRYEC